MRALMEKYFSNPKNQFIASSCCLFSFLSLWYFLFHKDISNEYQKSISLEKNVLKELNKFKNMQAKLGPMEDNWNKINYQFQYIIEKIPDKRLLENVTDHLYSDLIQNSLKVINFSPSNIAIDKETVILPDLKGEIVVEKIPIDITLRGSFLNFNKFLENLEDNRYRFTTSNVGVSQEKSSPEQTIELIAYAYFQSSKNKKIKNIQKIQKNKISFPGKQKKILKKDLNSNKIVDNVDKKDKIIINEELKDVPEMWLEPATEPIEEIISEDEKTVEKEIKNQPKEIIKAQKKAPEIVDTNPNQSVKDYNALNDLVVIRSSMCKKVKNNLPVYTSKVFDINDEKVICYSLVNNNTEKSKVVYHIWYMDGELKAKVRIIVRPGDEIPAISNRKVNDLDRGGWKIVITDINKMILDTVIFEVV
tara:strand:+ start:1515 stop:2771 length:1257 start_codon:yes stop_codon:yes gene_type:complete